MGATQVLIANGIWLLFLGGWCVAYFLQARADKAAGGRFAPEDEHSA